MIDKVKWEDYKNSPKGKNLIDKFRALLADEVTAETALNVANIIDRQYFENLNDKQKDGFKEIYAHYLYWIGELFNAFLQDMPEEDIDPVDFWNNLMYVLLSEKGESFETAEDIPQNRYKALLANIMPLSLALFHYLPDYFLPNLFVMQFIYLNEIAKEYKFDLPEMPQRQDYFGRCYYYPQLSLLLNDFMSENDILDPAEVCAFYYGYAMDQAEDAIYFSDNDSKDKIEDKLPPRAWLLVGNYSEGEKGMRNGFWQANPQTLKGDLLFFYEKSPVKSMNSIWIAKADGIIDPFFYYYSNTYLAGRIDIPAQQAITFEDFKASQWFKNRPSKGNFVNKNFQDCSGWEINRDDLQEILRILRSKGFDTTVIEEKFHGTL